MKNIFLIILIMFVLVSYLQGQVDDATKRRFEKAQVVRQKQADVIKFEPIKPDIERYQKKTDTDFSRGFFQLYKKNVRETNKVILNKWLKELK